MNVYIKLFRNYLCMLIFNFFNYLYYYKLRNFRTFLNFYYLLKSIYIFLYVKIKIENKIKIV